MSPVVLIKMAKCGSQMSIQWIWAVVYSVQANNSVVSLFPYNAKWQNDPNPFPADKRQPLHLVLYICILCFSVYCGGFWEKHTVEQTSSIISVEANLLVAQYIVVQMSWNSIESKVVFGIPKDSFNLNDE